MSLAKLEDNHQSHFWGTNLNIDLDKLSKQKVIIKIQAL